MPATFELKIGATLENGAKVVEYRYDSTGQVYVAADRGSEGLHRFVTWGCDREGNCFWGHYFDTQAEAIADLIKRTAR